MTRKQFESTADFQHFKEVMVKLIKVPKAELDKLVKTSKEASPRVGNSHAPGRKRNASSRKQKPQQ